MENTELFLKSIARLTEKTNKKLAESFIDNNIDLTPEQLSVLNVLWEVGSCSQQEIANRVSRERATITRILDTMEKKKLIKRKESASDKRANLITTTKKAEDIKELVLKLKSDVHLLIMNEIDGYELNMSQMLIDRILENV